MRKIEAQKSFGDLRKSWDFGNLQNASSQLRKLFISSVIFGNVRSNFSVEEQKLTKNILFLETSQNEEILSSVFYNDILLEKVEFLVWTALHEITSCRKFIYLKSFDVRNQSQLCKRISNSTVCLFWSFCLVFLISYFDFLYRIASKILCFKYVLTFVTFGDRHKLLIQFGHLNDNTYLWWNSHLSRPYSFIAYPSSSFHWVP